MSKNRTNHCFKIAALVNVHSRIESRIQGPSIYKLEEVAEPEGI